MPARPQRIARTGASLDGGSRHRRRAAEAGRALWSAVGMIPVLAMLVLCAPATARAAGQLVMFEQAHCPWCEAWEAEVGSIYMKTAEGRVLPLRRVDIEAPVPADVQLSEPVRFTPTFVVLDDGVEIGRVTGYTGEYQFWGLLGPLARQLEASDR